MLKVFILDDDAVNNEMEVLIMNLIGITDVQVRTNGIEAIQYLNDCRQNNSFPDLMLIDLNIPGMNGFEFIQYYEKNFLSYSSDSKIIMLTNSILDNERFEALKYKSVLDFWIKPLTKRKLLDIIPKLNVKQQ